MPSPNDETYYTPTTELADLGPARFNHDTAAIDAKDYSLTNPHGNHSITVQPGRAPKGLESQVFAWNTFQFTTGDRDVKEEKKGDLHEGVLHRANRVAAGGGGSGGVAGDRRKGGRAAGGARASEGAQLDALCAGRKPEGNVPPLAKGFAEELDESLFWDERIC